MNGCLTRRLTLSALYPAWTSLLVWKTWVLPKSGLSVPIKLGYRVNNGNDGKGEEPKVVSEVHIHSSWICRHRWRVFVNFYYLESAEFSIYSTFSEVLQLGIILYMMTLLGAIKASPMNTWPRCRFDDNVLFEYTVGLGWSTHCFQAVSTNINTEWATHLFH